MRNLAIDRLRGALVVIMVTGDYIAGINWIPTFLKHAPDIGFTIADTVAPAFVFVIALNFIPSFTRRLNENKAHAYRHFFQRYLSLIGVGAIITAGAALADRPTGWGVLESLGVAGVITVLFARLPTWARFAAGLALLIGYQLVLDAAMVQKVLHTGHGGLFGAISWSALLLLSTAVADLLRKGRITKTLTVVALASIATLAAFIVPVSKNRVSLSFVLITLTLSALTYLVVQALSTFVKNRPGVLSWWGQHALGLYVTHLLVLSVFGLSTAAWWYADAPAWLVALQLAGILTFMSFVARYLNKRRAR